MTSNEIKAKRIELRKAIWDAEDRICALQMQIASANRELVRLNYQEQQLNDCIIDE